MYSQMLYIEIDAPKASSLQEQFVFRIINLDSALRGGVLLSKIFTNLTWRRNIFEVIVV